VGTVAFAQTKSLGGLLGTAAEVKTAVKGLNPETVANLQAAYNGESNASATYTAFAKKAAEEGYPSVAALFRAASASEAIHAKKFAAVLTSGDVEPKATVGKPEVGTTEENLKVAIAGETAESKEIYPKAGAAATAKGDVAAAKAFSNALAAESKHAQFYTEAAANLLSWKDAGKTFLLCPTCGYTISSADTLKNCPLCGVARDAFETFK
ncbi:MAG: rubrerythrin, partial [Kiritimatiellaeota bacterium]|nr:rubrerythrin [Kiritimatiellota bacterium]